MNTFASIQPTTLLAGIVLAAALSTGCGDLVTGTGEEGLVRYTLYTDYDLEETSIKDVTIVAGHTQRITAHLTNRGETEVGNDNLTHRVVPATGVTLLLTSTEQQVPDLEITVEIPGTYTIETLNAGEVIDHIDLDFDSPAALTLATQVRDRCQTDFRIVSGSTISVGEGSQVAFVPIPVDSAGARLAGDMDLLVHWDPGNAVASGQNLNGVYEDGSWRLGGPTSFYFIEPGTITSTFTDPAGSATVMQTFEVAPVDATAQCDGII